jgi:hypothetical protein
MRGTDQFKDLIIVTGGDDKDCRKILIILTSYKAYIIRYELG